MKKLIASVIALLMMTGMLAACNEIEDEPSSLPPAESKEASVEASEVSREVVDPYEHLRGIDLGGRDIMIYVEDHADSRYYSQEVMAHESSPDLISSAVQTRNDIVEELLNCQIKEARTKTIDEMRSAIANELMGTSSYDIVMPYMPDAASLAAQGAFYDLHSFDGIIKLDQPYWDQRANEDLSIANKLYFSTGDFSLLTFDCTHAIVFNKDVVESNPSIENPYELLANDKWTYDALYRNAKVATYESDGEDGLTWKDNIGLLINQNYTTTLFIGSGERLTRKDSEDYPYLALKTENAAAVVSKINEIYTDASATFSIEDITNFSGYNDVWSAATGAFADKRVLFRTLAITDLVELQAYENVNYGLLPTPKYTEEQDDYYNIVSCLYASCFAIPVSVATPEDSAAVCEAMAIASTETLRKSYYEVLLKGRYIKDEDGEFALDIIFNNRVYELGTIYTWGSLGSFIPSVAKSGSFESQYESAKDSIEAAIETTLESFKD